MAGVDAVRLALGMAVVVLNGPQLQACIFGSQPDCAFACNCANNATCDETTGACPNGCRDGQPRPLGDEGAFDWRGPGCRIGNVAYGKPATQSETLNNWIAGRAVDGRLPPTDKSDAGEYCAHTNSGGNAWWSVDLVGTYSIHNITIFNRRGSNGERTGHINITVSNSSDFSGASECVFYIGPLENGGNVTLPCGERLVGRYVKLQRTGGVDPNIINICEVVVMGYEVVMAYCGNCLISCSELSFIVGCGECLGYVPPHCTTPCSAGNFGINCLLSCSDHHCKGGHTACNHVTGECVNGCDNWYIGDKCNENITSPTTRMVTHTLTTTTEQGTPGSDNQVGVIAGATAGGLLLLTFTLVIVGLCIRRQKTDDTGAIGDDNMAAHHRLSDVSEDRSISVVGPRNKPLKAFKSENITALASASSSPILLVESPDVKVSAPQTPFVLELSSIKHSPSNPQTTEDPGTSVPISIVQLKTHITELLQPLPKDEVRKTKDGKKDITDGFGREFDDLPGADFKTRTIGRSHANQAKNRFKNIQPFDDSRVKIEATDELSRSDYINASYITGYHKVDKHYIAAQGPTEDTVLAFWFMIWQQRSNRIVMLTRINEGGKKKCAMYWPDDSDKETVNKYGPFRVSLIISEVHADYVYRRLHLSYKNEVREVHQLHFLAWEDKKCPENNFPLLAFRGRVRKLTCDPSGPLVVHCSAGVGRTGTYIALDYLLNQAKHECQVDVFVCVYRLRTQRMHMVQTEAQYAYLYNAVLEGIETRIGDIEIPSTQFIAQYEHMSRETAYANQNALRDEYEMMCRYKPQTTQGAASYVENIAKNRCQDIVPDDRHRPRLSTAYSEGNDYINAVFVDSYQSRNETILTQAPMPNTIVDFWRLVSDYDCNTIVMLNGMDSSETCGDYYPDAVGSKLKFGPIVVQNLSSEQMYQPNMVVRTFQVSKDRKLIGDAPRTVRQFQLLGWENKNKIPTQPNDLIALAEKVREWRLHQTRGTAVVHCIDGAERSGLFAAGCYMLDVLKEEQEVAVLQAARYITSRRPQAIRSMEHYQFLFDLARCYLSGFHTYGNV